MRFWKNSDPLICLTAAGFLVLGWWLGSLPVYLVPLILLTARALFPPERDPDAAPESLPPWYVWVLVATALALPPDLSDDHQRYLWEGFAQARGFSPYSHSPASLYDTLDHPAEGKVNNDTLPTIYPPLAQYLFRMGAMILPNLAGWKLLILAAFALFYRHEGGHRFLPFLITPLFLFEGVWNAHVDVFGLIPLFLLVAALERGSGLKSGIYLGLATALKLMPVLLFPACFLHLKGRQRLWFPIAFVLVVLLTYLPYLHEGEALFASFLKYSREWHFNNPFFNLLREVLPVAAVRPILASLILSGVIVATFAPITVTRKCVAIWISLFVFSPTLFPWYLIWLIPFVAPERSRFLHIAYTAASLSYVVLIGYRSEGVWVESWWWQIPEWLVLLSCFFFLMRPRRGDR